VSILSLALRRAHPGQGEALVQAIQAEITTRPLSQAQRIRLFQDLANPDIVQILGHWDNVARFEDRPRLFENPVVAACTRSPVEYRLYQRVRFYVDLTYPAAVHGITVLHSAPAEQQALAEALYAHTDPPFSATPGLVECAIYEGLQPRGRVLMLHSWQSRDAWATWIAAADACLWTQIPVPILHVRRAVYRSRSDLEPPITHAE
jgi:hypothetical protein